MASIDYKGSSTYKKPGNNGCKGCCSEGNHVGLGGVQHSSCSECQMTGHKSDCPRRNE